MITFEDAAHLLALAAARDQRTVGQADILAWQADLAAAGITRADAEAALAAFYQEMARRQPQDRFRATPVDLIDIALRARRERVTNLRYDGDPDETPAQYLARLRARTKALADGRIQPDTGLRALGPGTPDPRLTRALADVGREVPDKDAPKPTKRPTRLGPLSVRCPECSAPIGRKCRLPGSRSPRRPHRARLDAARVAAGQKPEVREDPDEIARRRAASARYLATHAEGSA